MSAPIQIRRTEADFGAYGARLNLARGRAFRHFAGAFKALASRQVVSAHLLRAASLIVQDQEFIAGSARGDLRDLKGFESALRLIIVRSAPHSRPPHQASETNKRGPRDSTLCTDVEAEQSEGRDPNGDDESQLAYPTHPAKEEIRRRI